MIANAFPALLQSFFTERLCRQRRAGLDHQLVQNRVFR
jgi:hypothetical protein